MRLPAHVVLMILLLLVPLMGVDCNETGDFLRGQESRAFAAAVLTQIATGISNAFVIATTRVLFSGGM